MYPPKELTVQVRNTIDDGIGGVVETWSDILLVKGYIDLLQGTDQNNAQNAFIEQSTHIAVLLEYIEGITDAMRLVEANSREYDITYVDNPVGVNHHIELYLKYRG